MRTTTLVITSLMLYFLASPVFSSDVARPVNVEFKPVDLGTAFARPVVYEKSSNTDAEQIMFYIPVYTMSVKKTTEPAVVPVKSGGAGGGVIMPIYNNIDVNRTKTYSPVNSGANSGSNPGHGMPDVPPSNPNISDGSGNSPVQPPDMGGILPEPSLPDIKPSNPSNPSNNGNIASDKPVTKNNDVKVIAAAPIVAGALGAATFKKGTTIKVKSCEDLTSEDRVYKRISFVTTEPVITTYSTIPIGTKIDAHIIKNKKPGPLGNGALISLKADNLIVDEAKTEVDGVVVKTKEKHVFFNNIKGDRTYLKNIAAHSKDGRELYRKMAMKSQKFLSSPKTILFAPFPVVAGAAGMAGKVIASPFTALREKGSDIYIAEGSSYEFKLKADYSRALSNEKISEN